MIFYIVGILGHEILAHELILAIQRFFFFIDRVVLERRGDVWEDWSRGRKWLG